MSTRERILGQCCDKVLAAHREAVNVPEWGEKLFVGVMSGDDRDAFESQMELLRRQRKKGDQVDLRYMKALVVVMSTFDGDGAPVFVLDDVPALNKGNAIAIDRLYRVSSRLNKLFEHDLEELAGNSEAAPSGNSGSSSPGPSGKASRKPKDK